MSGETLEQVAQRIWLPPPWKCSTPGWMGLWATWSSETCPCHRQGRLEL